MTSSGELRLVVMGVSGSGKSTLAAALGRALRLSVTDGDDLHLPENLRKMQAGVPLTDEDRWPWLDRVVACLQAPATGEDSDAGRVLACSALRRVYRDRLRWGVPGLRFVFLEGDVELLGRRMAQRTGHFMQSRMLQSQLLTLERPTDDEIDVLTLQADLPTAEQVLRVIRTWAPAAASPTRIPP